MIAIINYGVGNIKAFLNVYKKLDIPVKVVSRKEDLKEVNKLILPGVGAFDHAMEKLNQSGMRSRLDELVCQNKVPVIGVCVGMQMLAKASEEGQLNGLGWVDASVKRIDPTKILSATHLPHMGWNDVKPTSRSPLFDGLETEAKFYFLHSYYFFCNRANNEIASSDYGGRFTCAVNTENIYGVQFHPEKSHHYGVKLLENFAKLC